MFCINCGTELPDHARFCFNCGFPQFNSSPIPTRSIPFSYEDLVSYEYESVEELKHTNFTTRSNLTQYFILIKKNGKVGIANNTFSKIYLPCQFDSIEVYTTNSQYDKPFFKTKKGNIIGLYSGDSLVLEGSSFDILAHNIDYPPRFFFIRFNNGKYGIKFLSSSMALAKYCQPLFDSVTEYKCDTVKFRINGKVGMVNTYGTEIPALFDDISFVSEGQYKIDSLMLKYDKTDIKLPYTKKEFDGKRYSGYESKQFGFFYVTYIS